MVRLKQNLLSQRSGLHLLLQRTGLHLLLQRTGLHLLLQRTGLHLLLQRTGLLQFLFISVLLLRSLMVEAAPVQVQVKPDQPRIDEAFQLVFSASGNTDGTPDFSPLDQNFEILSQRKSSQSSWVNGVSSQRIDWTLNVMARRAGLLIVPGIAFGSDRSMAIEIEVQKAQASAGVRPDLFVEALVDSTTPYVQTQVIYTWRIYTRVNLSAANMSEPGPENALVVRLGDNRRYLKQLDGVDYQVIEGQYAIFPQQTGGLTIPPLALTAEVLGAKQPQPDMNRFFSFQRTTTRRVKSEALTLQVQAKPDSFGQAPWLAATQLELSQTWSDESLRIKVGEPLTRTLTLRAVGVPKSQLPDVGMDLDEPNLKTYPEQAIASERAFENGLSSVREQKVAIIAASAGRYLLPEIRVRWYNTQTGKVEFATLPSVTITALADPGMPAPAATDAAPPGTDVMRSARPEKFSKSERRWKRIAISLAMGWGLSLLWIWYRRTKQTRSAGTESPIPARHQSNMRKFSARLKVACLDHDAQKAGKILREWGMESFDASNLMDIATYCSEPLQQQITKLNQSLYSGGALDWDAQALYRAFNVLQKRPPGETLDAEPLRPLYPNQD